MYFKVKIATDLTVRGYKVTAKEVQALTRFVLRQMQRKYVLETFGVTVFVCEKQESHWSGFHFSLPGGPRQRHVSDHDQALVSRSRFRFNYLGMKIENLQQTLVVALGLHAGPAQPAHCKHQAPAQAHLQPRPGGEGGAADDPAFQSASHGRPRERIKYLY
jgi:hypothetical protein